MRVEIEPSRPVNLRHPAVATVVDVVVTVSDDLARWSRHEEQHSEMPQRRQLMSGDPFSGLTVFKWGGKALFVVGAVSSAVEIYNAQNRPREIAAQIGGWTGAWAGAEMGGEGGAFAGGAIGVWVGGVGAAPGAVIGGVFGSVGGGIGGFWAGHKLVTKVWDWIFTPLEKEEYQVVECPAATTQPAR